MKNYRNAECCGNCKYAIQPKREMYICNLHGDYFEEDVKGYFNIYSVCDMNVCDNYIPRNIIINKN